MREGRIGMPAMLRAARIDRLADAQDVPGWDLRFLQMSPGAFSGISRCLEVEGLQILRETFGGVVLNEYGGLPANAFVFGVPLAMAGEGLFNGGSWRNGVCFTRSERDFNTIVPPADMLTIVVGRDELVRYVRDTEQLDIEHWLGKRTIIVNDERLARDLGSRVNELLMACFAGEVDLTVPSLRRALLDSVLELLGPVVAAQVAAPMPAFREVSRSLIVKAARRYAVENIHEPLQVIDICRATGTSRRALQTSFQDVLGVSPLSYLRLVRLNGARQALLQPARGLQVKDVVARWGIWHFSRFSAEYRELFGELPSETLKRVGQGSEPA